MPVEPIPCADGGGGEPVEVTTCCAPSIASAPLCLADGTTVLAVVRSGCVECGEAAPDPEVVGWLDTAGIFTPGALPADAGPCDAGCLDTLCRQRCDDTDGDGQANETYSELYCVRADGSAELVLTYQDDPTVPYTPVSPVECTYGCPESETVTLCDDSGPFLRRYSWLAGVGSFEDVDLDGQTPHVVTGTVGACGGDTGCEAETTPAATLGLCLADGTPIAVVVTRDCSGTVTQDGWLNLTTGAYSAGDPPVGTMACGNPRSISTTGTFCDVDPGTGDVLGLVLIEYTYGPEGDVAAVRLVDATTGQTYTPQGEVTTCPAGVEQPERDLLQLCDTAGDGTVTEFVRDYARDETGQITGHTDYGLDGAPYTPTGTVGRCVASCHDCETVVLCDTVAGDPVPIAGTAASGTLSNGVGYAVTAPNPFAPGRQSDGAAWWGVAVFPNSTTPLTRWTFDQPVNVDFSVAMTWSTATALPGENQVQMPPGAVPLSLPAGYTYNQTTGILRVDSTLTGCTLNQPTRAQSARFRLVGVTTFTLQYLGTRVLNAACQRFGNWEFGALDVSLGSEFLRTVCRDCTGAVTSTTDTLLDGTTPYTPLGLVGVCQPTAEEGEEEPCRDSSSTLLCDTAAQEAVTVFDPANRPGADGWEIVSYTGYGPGYGPEAAIPYPVPHPAGSPAYMGVRSDLNVGPGVAWTGYDTAPVRWVMRKTFTAPEDGVAVVSSTGFRGDGGARVRVNGIDAGMYGQWNQPATTGTAQIPVTAGPNTVEIEVRDGAGPNWITGRLDVVMTRTVQFMRRTVVDCETGETVSVVDTTLDGDPYEVTGEVGQCEPVAECCEQPPPETRVDVETRELCLVDDETGAVLGRVLVERLYDDQNGERLEQRYVDPVTGDPVTPPAGASVAVCPPEPCRDTYTTQVCDLPTGDPAGVPTATDTSATPYPWDADPIRCVNQHPGGGQSLWDGGTVTIPARASGAGSCTPNQWLAGLAATLQAPRPSCDSGTVTITVAVAARNNGPAASAANYAGSLRIHRTDTGARLADSGSALGSMPAGTVRTMTATAVNVPAGLLAAGQIVVALDVESWDQTGNTGAAWLLSNFVAGYEFQQDGCETQFLRKIVTDCETGETVSVTDTTLDGEPYTVTGEVGQCTTLGSGEAGTCCDRTEVVTLCSTAPGGEVTPFLRHLTYPEGSGTPTIRDTLLDGTEYVPDGEVGTCAGSAAAGEGRDVELTEMCVVNNGTGTVVQRILAEVTYDTATGERLSVNYVDPATWGPVAMPGGTHLDVCPPAEEEPTPDVEVVQLCDLVDGADPVPFLRHLAYLPGATAPTVVDTALDGVTPYVLTGTAGACSEPCAVRAVVEACRCDDTDGDGLPDTGYVELLGVDCAGQLTSLGTYTDGLTEPYTPVSPVDCATVDDEEGAEPAHGVQARRVDLAAGASWDAAAVPALQSVTAVAHGGTGTITTADGPSTLRPGESVTWSVVRDVDAALTGPLTITTVTGTVTVSWTQGVTL